MKKEKVSIILGQDGKGRFFYAWYFGNFGNRSLPFYDSEREAYDACLVDVRLYEGFAWGGLDIPDFVEAEEMGFSGDLELGCRREGV